MSINRLPKIRISPTGRGFQTDSGQFFVPFGVNYYRPHTGWAPQVWKTFDADLYRRDFARIAEHGGNCIRIFLTYGSFYNENGKLDPTGLDKFDQFLDLAEENGLYVHPTGPDHWEGRPKWLPEDPCADEQMLSSLEAFWRLFAARYRGRNAIWSYDLRNEPVIRWTGDAMQGRWNHWVKSRYGSADAAAGGWLQSPAAFSLDAVPIPSQDEKPADPMLTDFQHCREDIADEWTRRQAAAIKSVDPDALVTVGFIQWTIPSYLHELKHYAAFRPLRQAPYLDFLEVHFYPLDNGGYEYEDREKELRQIAYLEGIVRECLAPGKPLVLAEFGWYGGGTIPRHDHESRFASDIQQAEHLANLVNSTAGLCCGWLNWGLYDHPGAKDCSLFTGLFSADGKPKAWAQRFKELAGRYAGRDLIAPRIGARPALPWDLAITSPKAGNDFRDRYFEAFMADRGRSL